MTEVSEFVARVEDRRRRVNATLEPETRAELGQFMTPAPVAQALAARIDLDREELHLLDPGAGVGSLTAAVVARILDSEKRPRVVTLTTYEVDGTMRDGLNATLADCVLALTRVGVQATSRIEAEDFVEASLAATDSDEFTAAILNPPFMKISAQGDQAARLRARGWSPANLYTAFWCAALARVREGGDVVAITPRSFCNGSYFEGFRHFLLEQSSLRHLHVFDARNKAFSEDGVLQETVVTHSVRGALPGPVGLALSTEPGQVAMRRTVPFTEVVHKDDERAFIRLPLDVSGSGVREWMASLSHTLSDLDITVSTGPVVDFRTRDNLRMDPEPGLVPLFYPNHFSGGAVVWPTPGHKKPNAIDPNCGSKLLTVDGHYCIVNRRSAKEERRRVVASYYDGSLGARVPGAGPMIGLENHLNYFHAKKQPLEDWMARGLTMFLNSTKVDAYFREFNGHTQVNAGDLKSLRYPSPDQLRILSKSWEPGLSQEDIDAAVESI